MIPLPSADTICATATAPGGAIGIIRVSGADAIGIVERIFRPVGKKTLSERAANSLIFGHIADNSSPASDAVGHSSSTRHSERSKATSKNPSSDIIDEVLVSLFRAPHSYTGEDTVEISCHGSAYIIRRTLELLTENGCRMANPGEYTQRAFLNGKMDLSQAEAVADLIASQSAASHRIAMQQMRGGYSAKLRGLRDRLLEMTSLLELELDFSEEDVEFADREKLTALAESIKSEIAHLTASFHLGNALKNGIPVAIIGAPNVGKSTLLNALLKDDRAIVSNIEGTTRDVIEDTITLGGITFRFIDTAGIRHTDDTIEQMGIERSIRAAEKAQIIILLTEPGIPFPEIPTRPNQIVLRITNKTPEFQALNGIGIKELEDRLIACIPESENELLVTNLRHYEALTHARDAITKALEALSLNLPGDLIAEDLRLCINHLSEILGGAITPSDTLNNIFKNFCIGK